MREGKCTCWKMNCPYANDDNVKCPDCEYWTWLDGEEQDDEEQDGDDNEANGHQKYSCSV